MRTLVPVPIESCPKGSVMAGGTIYSVKPDNGGHYSSYIG